jgi:hypothetical protein
MKQMSARTDRIEKLVALIAREEARNHPNNATNLRDKHAKFSAMTNYDYDEFMARLAGWLETGIGPSGLSIRG